MKHPDAKPKAKRSIVEPLSDKELLMLGIASLWRQDVNFHITGASDIDLEETVGLAVKIWDMNLDDCVKVSKAMCLCTLTMNLFRGVLPAGGSEEEVGRFKETLSKLIKASM